MNVLEIQNLHVGFDTENGQLSALKNISFNVPENRIVGVVGESGCGKSTLVNAILGLLADNGKIIRGKILFEEREDLAQLQQDEMRELRGSRISTVFQDPMGALNPVISVGRQMLHIQYRTALNRTEKNAKSVEFLKRVRIPDPESALNRYPHEFSGGMKQRIAIAMALMMEPALLIADEPTTALDATLEVATIELLQELQAEFGCSVLFISHHLGVVAELCDDVVVMYAGELVERGTTRQIFHDPWHPYTERLLSCDPANQTAKVRILPTIPGEIPDLRTRPQGCIFANRCQWTEAICTASPPEVHIGGHCARCHRLQP